MSEEEFLSSLPRLSGAAWPDDVSARVYRSLPSDCMVRILNLLTWYGAGSYQSRLRM